MTLLLVLFSALAAPKASISAVSMPGFAQPLQAAYLTSQQTAASSQAPSPAQRAVRTAGPVELPGGITFRNFNGANGLFGAALNQQLGLGWNRTCFGLSTVEPQRGKWDWTKTDAAVQGAHNEGVQELPCLLGAGWAAISANGPPKDVHDWEDFVEHFVSRYSAPPFNLRYFEVWNEPTRAAGFWSGTNQQFIDSIYLPAAKIIRRHHCFVVFGGWPLSNSIEELNAVLNYNNAWQWTDIVNVHYRDVAAWQQLYNVWVKTGKCRGIWQSEVGFAADPSLLLDVYLKTLYLALQGRWQDGDQYKLFWYASWGAGADADKCLTKGPAENKVLSQNGQHLATMSDVLGPGPLAAFAGFQMQPALPAAFASKVHTVLGFKVGADRTVLALLLDKATFTGNSSLIFSIGLHAAPHVTELVTASGQRQQLHGVFNPGVWHIAVPMQSVQSDCPSCSFTVAYLRME